MGTYIRAGIMTICVILLAYMMSAAVSASMGRDAETNLIEEYGDMMVEARELFVTLSEEFQTLTMECMEMDGLSLCRRADGSAAAMVNGEPTEAEAVFNSYNAENPGYLTELADAVCTGADISADDREGEEMVSGHAQVLSIQVLDGSVWFFTHFHENGYVGVCFLSEPSAGTGMDTIELIENWQIFYKMA